MNQNALVIVAAFAILAEEEDEDYDQRNCDLNLIQLAISLERFVVSSRVITHNWSDPENCVTAVGESEPHYIESIVLTNQKQREGGILNL
jgi:hypothetical protein